MKKMATLLLLLMFAAPAHGQRYAANVAVPLEETVQPEPVKPSAYDKAHAQASLYGKPFVVFVGIPSRDVKGCVTVSVDTFNGSAKQRIVVCPNVNEADTNYYAVNDDAAIRQRAGLEASVSAIPFASSSRERSQAGIADDSHFVGGRWQAGLAFLNDLEPYQSARRVQQTFRRWSGYIGSVDRLSVKPEWRIAGGLVGVSGWSNQLFRTPNLRQATSLVRQDESDSSSAVTWWRNYPSGATFADVIRNDDGRIFEVRVAEKHGANWERYVAFRDVSARPHGYESLTRSQCANCHNQAGNSAYADSAIPGADTIISDPIEPVESGRMVQGGFGVNLN